MNLFLLQVESIRIIKKGAGVRTETTKFIITGQGRCGSNLLKFALKKHPQCQVIGEYFNKKVYDDVFEEDGKKRAEHYFSSIKKTKTCIGFKIFAHQGTRTPARSVWHYLTDPTNNIHVIHLIRANRFERLLSLEIARKTGAWKYSENSIDRYLSQRINHSPEWWQKAFNEDEKTDNSIKKLFRKSPYLSLNFEFLINEWDDHIAAIEDFLHIKAYPLPKTLKKQETLKQSERVVNYNELKDYFFNTDYAWMFYD
jgi:hypothetical protein